MVFEVIDNPDAGTLRRISGFRATEFKKLAGLFSQAASRKVLYDIGVDVDFDAAMATVTYYKSNAYHPYLQFVVRRVGPQTDMYEVYLDKKGLIARSTLFDRAYTRLAAEIDALF